jgi:hypothetical protein
METKIAKRVSEFRRNSRAEKLRESLKNKSAAIHKVWRHNALFKYRNLADIREKDVEWAEEQKLVNN